MKKLLAFVLFLTLVFSANNAHALTSALWLQVHNPTGGNPSSPEPADVKSQFAFLNTSDAGINISSILYEFASPIFIDSTSAAPGFGGFRDFTVSPAATYGGLGSGEFQITVLVNSDVLVGYTGPTNFTNGANSLLLTFNNFNPNEAFGFWTDLDTTNNTTGRVGNSDFDNSKTTITFSDGTELVYIWDLPANNGRSFYGKVEGETTTNVVPEPATMLLFGAGLVGTVLKKRRKE